MDEYDILDIYVEHELYDDAIIFIHQVFDSESDDYLFYMGMMKSFMGDFEEGVKSFQVIKELCEGSDIESCIRGILATLLSETGRQSMAEEEIAAALALKPNSIGLQEKALIILKKID